MGSCVDPVVGCGVEGGKPSVLKASAWCKVRHGVGGGLAIVSLLKISVWLSIASLNT